MVHSSVGRNSIPMSIFARRAQEHPLAFIGELEKQFSDYAGKFFPQGIEVHDAGTNYVIIAEAVGLNSVEIEVEILGKNVTIKGNNQKTVSEVKDKATEKNNTGNDNTSETSEVQDRTSSGEGATQSTSPNSAVPVTPRNINYNFSLPGNVIVEEVTADLALGLLTITAPKQPEIQGRKVSVQSK